MKTIQEKIFDTFFNFKEETAIEYGDRKISYEELDWHSNRIANYLLENAGKGTFIGVLIEDRLHFITAMIGILKAGCVFIPLEPTFPTMRLKKIIDFTDSNFVICDGETIKQFKGDENSQRFLNFNEIDNKISCEKPQIAYFEDDKVYIYNTSGTTGAPKAVVGRNISLLHFIAWEIKTFSIDSSFKCSQFTNVGFDVFLRDTLVPLCSGACVCIPEHREIILNGSKLIQWIDENRIDLIHCVPSVFALFNTDALNENFFKRLKYIFLAGEKVRPGSLHNWFSIFKDRIQLVNLYGPTETTLAKMYYLITEQDKNKNIIPIGKPISGAQAIVLNENMQLCDEFETGEIYIRTPYRSFGYYKNRELIEEKFIKNPLHDDPSDIIYKTGDLGRILPDGNIELLGRTDRQIKIRGIRIELEEIESVIVENQRIKEAVVVNKEISENNQLLYAYVTLKDQPDNIDEDTTIDLIAEISQKLPQYMVPAYVIVSNEIPRKLNGKIDYNALPDPLVEPLKCIAPRDEREEKLLEIWREILNIEEISVDDSFFEKGGNSLNLMNLILSIHEEFSVEINFEQIALENTIERQAEFIKNAVRESLITIPRVEKKYYYSTTSAQGRLYFLQNRDKASTVHNLPIVAKIKGPFNRERMEAALNLLVKRHESLRTSFAIKDGALVQIINEDVKLEIVDFEFDSDKQNIKECAQELVKCFELSDAPLVRVFLSQQTSENYLIIFDFHHIIFDGFSLGIFFNDLIELSHERELPELRIQYKDYTEYQNSERMKEIQKKQERYWLDQFKGQVPTLRLPQDYTGDGRAKDQADVVQTTIDEKRLIGLKKVAQSNDTTLFTVMLASCYVVLSKISGQEDIVIGIPTNGRRYADLDKIVGMFVNTIALRGFPEQSKSLSAFLNEVKSNLIRALENQDYQFDVLVQKLNLSKTDRKNPLFEIMFQMQKNTQTKFSLPEIEFDILDINLTSEFEITFNITEYDEKLVIKIIYKKALFDRKVIQQLLEHFECVLEEMCSKVDICIEDIDMNGIDQSRVNKETLDIQFNFDL